MATNKLICALLLVAGCAKAPLIHSETVTNLGGMEVVGSEVWFTESRRIFDSATGWNDESYLVRCYAMGGANASPPCARMTLPSAAQTRD